MFNVLSRNPKAIAKLLLIVIYMQLVAMLLEARANDNLFNYFPRLKETISRGHINPALSISKQTEFVRNIALIKNDSSGIELNEKIADKDFDIGGPSQPEMQSFQSVNSNNMVDLFSGDFSYNIPLLDVGGYGVSLGYRGGITMDQEASWVGLGWNINPGTITRNMRGLPDDFDGRSDSVKKVNSIRENKTVGVTTGFDLEVVGFPLSVGASLGIFHNNYKGWGLETAINSSINSGKYAKGPLSAGLSITNNSQDGLSITPSLSLNLKQKEGEANSNGIDGSLSLSLPYNSRAGLKGLQVSTGISQYKFGGKDKEGYTIKNNMSHGTFSSFISFASPTYTPSMSVRYTSRQFSFNAKVGQEFKVVHPSWALGGYVSKQYIAPSDTLLALPSYGYLNLQEGANNKNALLDFNREKELPYREKPAVPHIAVPGYTYDAFSISGEGTGGMFRAYRGDIGFVYDHFMRSRDESDRLSLDIGVGDLAHVGIDLNINRAYTETGPWQANNPLANIIKFKENKEAFEAVYFRNPGEKAINSKQFYDAIGGDDVVTVDLFQPGVSSSNIQTTNRLTRYKNKKRAGQVTLTPQNVYKAERDKRTQVISYLTAKEASIAGTSKYINNYTINQFNLQNCSTTNPEGLEGTGTGLPGEYFKTRDFSGVSWQRTDTTIDFNWGGGIPYSGFPSNNFSIRWTGRLKAPATGSYTFSIDHDDAVRLWVNDTLLLIKVNGVGEHSSSAVNLIGGEMYKIKLELVEYRGDARIKLKWAYPGQIKQIIPKAFLYPMPSKDTFVVNSYLVQEKRVNKFRKENHLSEIDVLNADGSRYIYDIPVYNLRQREATFAINSTNANKERGLARYAPGTDNSTNNQNGKDWYYNSEEVPAYAHSFLLTGILTPDYVDRTGNGISDDDPGNAIKFNYSKIRGIGNPYGWRAPYTNDSVTYNEGLKTDNRDDKGNYVYGEKELWYLHSIESKTMIATFTVESRDDLPGITENGVKYNGAAKRLIEINLYSKAEFLKNPSEARAIKTVHFEYSYELCKGVNKPVNDTGKLTLKKVWFTYNGNKKGQRNPYVFHYNANNPDYNIRSYDRWSSYKDPLQNPGSTTGNIIGNDEYPYSLQDSSQAAYNAGAWTLDSIYLPSGGSMKIDFESDEYAYVQNKRAMRLFKILGFGSSPNMSSGYSNKLYSLTQDNRYVYISVPQSVSNKTDVYRKYLEGVKKLYFRLYVQMPSDDYGSGYEYVPCYATLQEGDYGLSNANTIWVKITGISLKGDGNGDFSPLAKSAIQFLRLNLPSKAYPGSEVGDNVDLGDAVKIVASQGLNIIEALGGFDRMARGFGWASITDLNRTYIRLNDPDYRKFGGGHRVKRITIYDNWDKMTNQRAAKYGQEYTYTTKKEIDTTAVTISSGVACYEPGIGNDENPFHQPIEYIEQVAPLAPVSLGYSEEPLGESFYPSPSVGYSKVRVRTINYKDKKSANGYSETQFYTAYDFPVFVDHSMLDDLNKKRYKPALANFLRINAKHHIVLSQGFKIELNDMHGKMRSQAAFAENSPKEYISYTEMIYKVEDPSADRKRLSNTVMAMRPDGTIDSAALIGKDVELMVDMRQQLSVTNGYNIPINLETFTFSIPPVFLIPTLLNLAQREENLYRSVATFKVVQRYGIVDSVISIDKGSYISTKDMLYDSETGEAILNRTQNEFNDPIYSFTYPSHWAYDAMGLAYKNIDVVLDHINIREGRIISGLDVPDSTLFSGGDEILVGGKQKTGPQGANCTVPFSKFPSYTKIWSVDSSLLRNYGPKSFYFIDEEGKPYTGYDVSLKIIRSGRRNQLGSVGSVTMLKNPLAKNGSGNYEIVLNTNSKVISTAAAEYKQLWKVEEVKKQKTLVNCVEDGNGDGMCGCLKPFFDYLISSEQLLILKSDSVTVRTLVQEAINDSFLVDTVNCSVIRENLDGFYYQDTAAFSGWSQYPYHIRYADAGSIIYAATIGNCYIRLIASTTSPYGPFEADMYDLSSRTCEDDKVYYTLEEMPPGCSKFQVNIDMDSIISVIGHSPSYHIALTSIPSCAGTPGTGLGYLYFYPPYQDTILQVCAPSNWTAIGVYYRDAPVTNPTPAGMAIYGALLYDSSCSDFQDLRTVHAILELDSCHNVPCDTIYSGICNNPITDSTFNPYLYGSLGNWRGHKSYVYYGERVETDPTAQTDIRKNGAFNEFTPFWAFQSGRLRPQYDSTKWVWNSEMTLFNSRGLEVENKDPLGRFNAGLYGYNLSLPVAVIQNSHYRESAFEGFEDYGYLTQTCDTACPTKRHFDFSLYKEKLDTTQKHSGKNSLRLEEEEEVALSFNLSTYEQDVYDIPLNITTAYDACVTGGNKLKSIKASENILFPTFTPTKGQRMVISAWVREDQDCKCSTYTNNRIVVIAGGETYIFTPAGSIIEGWQRYESVFDIPAEATELTVSLEATGSATVYFDDLRIHPFNANMKSFVFNPLNLRLMAELDENNYATFYEYDDDGTLIRRKKETQRGIKTITETRSALKKDN